MGMGSSREFKDWGEVLLDVIMGYECNVQCDYCSVTEEMRRLNMGTKRVLLEVSDARKLGIHKVSFGGGEPTIRKDLLPIVRFCRDRGYDFVKVVSNGLMFSYEEYAKEAVQAGITQFNLSIMAHTEALYESIMGLPGALGIVRKGVENLLKLGVEPIADLIIKNDTYQVLPDIVEFWTKVGIRKFVLWLVSLTDRNKDNVDSLPMVTTMRPYIFRTFDTAARLGVFCQSRHIPRCMLRGYESFVRDLREDKVLVVTPNSKFKLWESVISANTYVEKCKSCRFYEQECMGVRRDYLERYSDAEIEPYL